MYNFELSNRSNNAECSVPVDNFLDHVKIQLRLLTLNEQP